MSEASSDSSYQESEQSADTYVSSEVDMAVLLSDLFQTGDNVNVVEALLMVKQSIDAQTEALLKLAGPKTSHAKASK